MMFSNSSILIVDDDEEIVRTIDRILRSTGASVLSAYDVQSAMVLLKNKKPHMIITDIGMSPLSGFDFIQILKRDKELAQIPVAVLSSHSEKNDVHRALALGAVDYVVKPIQAAFFVRRIRRVLKIQDYLRFQFPENEQPVVTTSIRGTIHSIGPVSVRIESGTCLSPCADPIHSEPISSLVEIEQIRFSVQTKGLHHVKGLFVNELVAIPAKNDFQDMRRSLLE